MLVAARELVHGVDVDAPLVREGGAADERRASAGTLVGDLIDEKREVAQLRQAFVAQDAKAHFELEIGDAGDQVAIAGPLAVAVDRPLDLRRARLDARQRVGDAEAAIVMRMDAQLGLLHLGQKRAGDLRDFRGKRPAVGVAKNEIGRARLVGGLVAGGRVFGILLVTVEGVLAVEDDFTSVLDQIGDGIADHGEVLLQRGAQDLRDVQDGGLADERDDRRARFEEQSDLLVVFHPGIRAARAAEGREPGVLELQLPGFAKELDVLFVRAGPAALDVVHPEGVEALGDAQLVGERKVDALTLRAVAQRGVVERDVGVGLGHDVRNLAGHGNEDRAAGRFRPGRLNAFSITRKDAKDGATKQGRASANSDDDRRQRIPQPGGRGNKREGAHAHITIKQGTLRIVKKGGSIREVAKALPFSNSHEKNHSL